MSNAAIVVMAGRGLRAFENGSVEKQYADLGGKPMYMHCLMSIAGHDSIDFLVLVVPGGKEEFTRSQVLRMMPHVHVDSIVAGGARRQDSVRIGLDRIPDNTDNVLIHDAARPFLSRELVDRVLRQAALCGACSAAVSPTDTIARRNEKLLGENVDRDSFYLLQTPQCFKSDLLRKAHEKAVSDSALANDDAELVARAGHDVHVVEGNRMNFKITTPADMSIARSIAGYSSGDLRTGLGLDFHRFATDERPLVLGGTVIKDENGLKGHSDADVVLHAVLDAILGATGQGDIGTWFPPGDPATAGIRSTELVRKIMENTSVSFNIRNMDITVTAQRPRLAPHALAIRKSIADLFELELSQVGFKATTTETMGAIGRGEGMAAQAAVLIDIGCQSFGNKEKPDA